MENYKTKIGLSVILLTLNLFLYAQKQKKIDSLLSLQKTTKNDTIKVRVFSSLCHLFRNSNSDTALYFGEKGLILAKKIKWDKGISSCSKNLGIVNFEIGQYENAIRLLMNSLKIDEKNQDLKGIAACYNHIGGIYYEQRKYDKSEEYYLKSLHIKEKFNDKKGIASVYNNIGLIYYSKKNYKKALDLYSKHLVICEKDSDKYSLAGSYNNVGMVHADMGNTDLAISYYLKSLKLRKEIGDKKGISAILGNIALLNITLADSSKNNTEKKKFFSAAIEYGLQCLKISEEINVLLWKNKTAEILWRAYKGFGNIDKSLEYAEIFITTNDSLFREEEIKTLANMEAKYQNEKKQLKIDKLEKEKELQFSENKKQRIVIWFIISCLILLIVIVMLIFRSLRITRNQKRIIGNQKQIVDEKNEILNQQNEEIRTQRDEIESQRDEIITQRDLVTMQKEQIEEIYQEVTDSINYAKRIQQDVLPNFEEILRSKTQNSKSKYQGGLEFGAWNLEFEVFVLFRPKDVVSGDFYWATKVNEFLIVAVADCTGHGVPGAFMSMLGISFLNEIVRKKEKIQASHVLDHLRSSVVDALKQTGADDGQKDGMDLVLVVINTDTLEMQFSGANNPLWIVKKVESYKVESYKVESNKVEDQTLQTFELYELKGDKMPVAIHERMEPFTNNVIQLQKGDTLYLASDGYEDQFGGEKRKKFLAKNMKELIRLNSYKPMNEQRKILENTIIEWIGIGEQIDDITVMGIKIL